MVDQVKNPSDDTTPSPSYGMASWPDDLGGPANPAPATRAERIRAMPHDAGEGAGKAGGRGGRGGGYLERHSSVRPRQRFRSLAGGLCCPCRVPRCRPPLAPQGSGMGITRQHQRLPTRKKAAGKSQVPQDFAPPASTYRVSSIRVPAGAPPPFGYGAASLPSAQATVTT